MEDKRKMNNSVTVGSTTVKYLAEWIFRKPFSKSEIGILGFPFCWIYLRKEKLIFGKNLKLNWIIKDRNFNGINNWIKILAVSQIFRFIEMCSNIFFKAYYHIFLL